MCDAWQLVSESQVQFELNGVKLTAHCQVETQPDDYPDGDFDFGDADENRKYLDRFDSGELECVLIRVLVRWNGIEGTDYLGMSHVCAASYVADVVQAVADHGMVGQALDDLQRELSDRLPKLKALIVAGGAK